MTISGANFPASLTEGDEITLEFSDGTQCIIQSVSTTEITCEVQPFKATSRRMRNLVANTFSIIINGKEATKTIDVPKKGMMLESISPATASPILTQLLTLQLPRVYDSKLLDTDEWTVGLVTEDKELARPNGDMIRYLNVVEYDKSANTISVKYGGAYSGEYTILLRSKLVGPFNTEGITFTARFEYTDFNPKSGSRYGGSLITIEGGHFSEDIQKNPVKIGYDY